MGGAELLEDLNDEQRAAVTHGEGPLLVVAGAGTGKTQVITRRIAYLIATGKAKPSEIVALTFTEKAAAEMEERVDKLLPMGMVETRIMTFHAYGDSLIKEHGLEMGLSPQLQLMSRSQQLVFLRDHIDELQLEYFAPLASPDRYLEALATYFSRLKEELITPAQYAAYAAKLPEGDETQKLEAARQRELAQAYGAYTKIARQRSLMDFSDQIGLALELFQSRPNILAGIRKGIKYILVDEFQDTNYAQAQLLEALAGENGNIMVVGDDDQSIYKFRGAAISNILSFTARYPKAKKVVLTRNYRSTQQILDAAYRLIRHNNPDRLEVKEGIDKYLRSSLKGQAPVLMSLPAYALEAEAVGKSIKARLDKGEAPGSLAVLVRKRSQAELMAGALRKAGVPYRYSGSDNLFKQSEIQQMLYFLQYIVNPTDSVALYHLLAGEVYRLKLQYLMESAGTARRRNQSLEEVLKEGQIGDEAYLEIVSNFLHQCDEWREMSREYSVGELAYHFIKTTGYLDRLVEDSKSDLRLEAKVRNLSQFFAHLTEYERVAEDRSALGYMLVAESIRESGEAPEVDGGEGLVQVMTVHRAKGLEFDTVYLFDLTRGTFPSVRRSEALSIPDDLLTNEVLPQGEWHLQEERRLMYVAMTRAKTNLIITYSPDHGGVRAKKPSPFIAEAMGVEPPALVAAEKAPLQQIELFRFDRPEAPPLPARFWRGEMLRLTPHQIDDYLSCPENFRYQYVLEVPQPPQPRLMYGSLVHAAIHQYYTWKKQGKVDLAKLLELVPAWWSSDGFVSKGQEERLMEQARETIRRFYVREEAAVRVPKHSERDFTLELPEYGVTVAGRFDAVYDDGQSVEIRDFKTSQVEDAKKADDKARGSVQLAIYALAWQQSSGRVPDRVVLDFVDTGTIGQAVLSEADLMKIKADIGRVADGIRSGDFRPGKSHFYCAHPKVTVDEAA